MKYPLHYATHLIGFTSMVAQILLMRELMVVFYGNELSISIILGMWLIWTAIGSSLLGRIVDRLRHPERWLVGCQFLAAYALPASIVGAREYRNIFDTLPGELLGINHILLSAVVLLAPLCLLVGFQFSLACRLFSLRDTSSAEGISLVYLQESVGASIGGLLMSLLLIRWLSTWQIVWIVSLLNLLGAIFLCGSRVESSQQWRSILRSLPGVLILGFVSLLVIGVSTGFFLPPIIERVTGQRQWRGLELVTSQNSVYGNIAITRVEGQLSFFENGLLMFSTGNLLAAEEATHFALLEHPEPRSVLLIGGGLGGTIREILRHPVQRLDYVELDPLLIQLGERYLPPKETEWDSRVSLHYTDARLWVQKAPPESYDVVLIHLPEPFTAQLARFYSVEFFGEVWTKLKAGGVVAFSIASSENYLGIEQRLLLCSLEQTLKKVFPAVEVLPGERNHFIAQKPGDGAISITRDARLLLERLKERKLKTQYVSEFYLPFRLNPMRLKYLDDVLQDPPPGTQLNYDLRPIAYFYDMLLWTAQFQQRSAGGRLITSLIKLRPLHIVLGIVLIIGLGFLWQRRHPTTGIILAIGTTGFSEILFQIIVILAFQVLYGYVYYKLSLILASFMVGLVLGSWSIRRLIPRFRSVQEKGAPENRSGHAALSAVHSISYSPLHLYRWTQLAICLYPLLLIGVIWSLHQSGGRLPSWIPVQSLFAFLPVVAGFIGGFQFPLASYLCLETGGKAGQVAGGLYGVDLLGSCAGALLGALVFVPILGLFTTCWLVTLLNFGVLLLLLLRGKTPLSPHADRH